MIRVFRFGRKQGLLCLALALIGSVAVLPAQGSARKVAIFGSGKSGASLSGLFLANGFEVQAVSAEELGAIDEVAPDLLVIGQGTKVLPETRGAIDRYRRKGGDLVVLDPTVFAFPNEIRNPVLVTDLSAPEELAIGKGSLHGETPKVEVRAVEGPDGAHPAVEIETRRIGEGDVELQLSLEKVRSSERSILAFDAKGGRGVSILQVAIRDRAGRKWVSFAFVTPEWTAHELAFEDFLPQKPRGEEPEFLSPADVKTLEIGMISRVLWTEQGGSFSVSNIRLGEASRKEPIRTAAVAPWSDQYSALNIPFPDWIWDPFWEFAPVGENLTAVPVPGMPSVQLEAAGTLVEIPQPPHQRGRTHAPSSTKLEIEDRHHRTLATVLKDGKRVTVAEWRRYNDGPYAGSSLVLIGAPEADFSSGSSWGALLLAGVQRVFEPAIIRAAPVLPKWKGRETPLQMRVEIANPSTEKVDGTVVVNIGSGAVTGEETISVAGGETVSVDVELSAVPADFDWGMFVQRIEFRVGNRVVDSVTDRIDSGAMLLHTARYLVSVQEHHVDGRFSHHYFSDQYSARFLAAFARFLRSGRGETLGLDVTEAEINRFEKAAFDFGDMIVRRQDPDGSFPMGYFEHRDFRYVADLGQVSMGLVQLASWLPKESPRRQSYLETLNRYLEFRQSFRMTPEVVNRLEAEYGPQNSIREGYYGLGLLDLDYFSNERWGELRREERGPWWVLPVSMGFLGGLYQLEQDPEVREIARMDVETYFDSKSKITQVAHFHAESLFWILYAIDDPAMRAEIGKKLNRELPGRMFRENEYPYFEYQGRAAIWPISAVYAHRYLGEKPAWRSVFLAGFLASGADSSSKSLRNVVDAYPITTYGPSLGAYRYAAFNSFWMLELLDEGSSLVKGELLPEN